MCDRRDDDPDQESSRLRPSRRDALKAGAALLAAPFLEGATSIVEAASAAGAAGKDPDTAGWSSYAGDKASSKYSPLAQIGPENFDRLKVAWTWSSPDEEIAKANPELRTWVWESTPLLADGVLYVSTSMSQVAAIDAADRQDASGSTTRRRGSGERRRTTASCIAGSRTGRTGTIGASCSARATAT